MYYTIYATINKKNGNFYIGMHKTENLDDGYLGSGIIMEKAKEKYGKDGFVHFVFEFCKDETEMILREGQLVTQKFIDDHRDVCYNRAPGGVGGWKSAPNRLSANNPKRIQWKMNLPVNLSETDPKRIAWMNKTETTRKEISERNKGTIWIYNIHSQIRKQIQKQELSKFNSSEWVFGNKVKTSSNKNLIWITDGKENRMVYPNEISDGWTRGQTKNITLGKGSFAWVYNDKLKQQKRIRSSELQKYIDDGWVRGNITSRNSKNCVWVSNQDLKQSKIIKKQFINEYLCNGWMMGKLFSKPFSKHHQDK